MFTIICIYFILAVIIGLLIYKDHFYIALAVAVVGLFFWIGVSTLRHDHSQDLAYLFSADERIESQTEIITTLEKQLEITKGTENLSEEFLTHQLEILKSIKYEKKALIDIKKEILNKKVAVEARQMGFSNIFVR